MSEVSHERPKDWLFRFESSHLRPSVCICGDTSALAAPYFVGIEQTPRQSTKPLVIFYTGSSLSPESGMNVRARFYAPPLARSFRKLILCLASQRAADAAEEMGPHKNVKINERTKIAPCIEPRIARIFADKAGENRMGQFCAVLGCDCVNACMTSADFQVPALSVKSAANNPGDSAALPVRGVALFAGAGMLFWPTSRV
jgi:hypothetical protein